MKKKEINIFHLSPFPFHSGGIDTWLNHFIKSNKDLKIHLYCPSLEEKNPIFNIKEYYNLEIIYLNKYSGYLSMLLWSVKVFWQIRKRINRNIPNLALSTIPTMMPVALLKKLCFLKGKIICSHRGFLYLDAIELGKGVIFSKSLFFFEKFLLSFADLIVSNGWDTQKYLLDYYKLNSIVVPNAISLNIKQKFVFRDDDIIKVRAYKNKGYKIISHIGTLREIKGINYIINAFEKISNNKKYLLLFVGKGNIERYQQICNSKGLTVYFTGEKRNVYDYFEISDVIINISGGSGVSNSLLESLSCGKITLCWDKITFNQLIKDDYNGYLAVYKDVNSLAETLLKAINNVSELKKNDIIKSVEKYNWDIVNKQWQEIIFLHVCPN